MVKTYNMCYYESESKICLKTIISRVNSLHTSYLLEFRSNFYFMHAHSHGDSVPKYCYANWILLCPENFVLNIHHNKTKIFPP